MRLFSHHSENFFIAARTIENIQYPNLLLYKIFPFL